MDVTSNTVTSNSMLSGTTATKNDGTSVTGNIAIKTSSNLTASGATVTAPAGYYANDASKSIGSGSAITPATTITKNPTISLTSSTGVVTASYNGSSSITPTVTAGYVTTGTAGTVSTTGTSTYQLTSKAAATYNTSTTDQTIASNQWLVGAQTIKSVTTSNLTAANIAEGVVVKIGDANNASRIAQITGTHSGATSYTATISGSGNSSYCYVTYNGTKYYTSGNTFTYKAGDTLTIYCRGNSLTINGNATTLSSYSYTYTLPTGNITIALTYSSSTSNNIKIWGLVQPTGTYSVSAAGNHNVYNYSVASVPAGSAYPPAVTITTNPSFTFVSSTGKITAAYTGSSSITPTVTAGWVSQGTAGTVSTSGTSTYTLTAQAAQTLYPSTADQTVVSYRWLTGTQTFKSVTTTNLTAANIAEGVTVKVGDANNASRITQVTGTHSGATSYTATISGSGNSSYCYVTYGGTKYYTNGNTFTYRAGDSLTIYCRGNSVTINGDGVTLSNYSYTYTLPVGDITINLSYSSSTSNNIAVWGLVQPTNAYTVTGAGTYNVYKYSDISVTQGSAYPPAVTITKNPTMTFVSSTGKLTAAYTGSSSITPTITSGWVSQGTAGTVSTSGTSTYTLTTKAATTYNTSTADQTIASYQWLTGTQTIRGVTTSNLTAENIAKGVTVKVGDANNASRITQVAGTYMPDYYEVYSAIANRSFINSSATYMESYCNNITSIGAGTFADMKMYGDFTFAEVVSIGSNAFGHFALNHTGASRTYNFPKATLISDWAFCNLSDLKAISAPLCTTIGYYAFSYCTQLSEAIFPACTSIGTGAFQECRSLTTISFPSCQSIGMSAFQYCSSLTTASFPSCTEIGSSTFYNCSLLTTISFPVCSYIGTYVFYNCTSLITVNFPACTSIGGSAFLNCSSLTTISLPIIGRLSYSVFANCFRLKSIYLNQVSSVPSITDTI